MTSTLVESLYAVARPSTVFEAPAPIEVTAAHRLARHPVVAVGQVDRTLLVVGLDERDLRLVLVERVHQSPDAVTGDACHVGHSVLFEDAGDDLPAVERGHELSFLAWTYRTVLACHRNRFTAARTADQLYR